MDLFMRSPPLVKDPNIKVALVLSSGLLSSREIALFDSAYACFLLTTLRILAHLLPSDDKVTPQSYALQEPFHSVNFGLNSNMSLDYEKQPVAANVTSPTEHGLSDAVKNHLSEAADLYGDIETAESMGYVRRGLKSRHIQFIALGGTIGTGLFLGIGNAFANAGPVSVLLGYTITGCAVFAMMQCLGEMATWLPLPGGEFCATCAAKNLD
ncbi:hypothetical protein IAQ61_007666 [Plenodomus lingam]|uniref:uncharacterized protein n=1 Tax=Leptosphaeria maculans TaxID=5022 RepID=UPI00332D2D27|nr:hypothetical protein IAQ61_007666 [Plenodomus lingam]